MAILVVPAATGSSQPSDPPDPPDPLDLSDRVRLIRAAYLARFTGESRTHTGSDLNVFLTWCAGRDVDPMTATRVHLEFFLRWMQETRRFKPSTVSRRLSVVTGFYRTAVIDGVLEHSPAEYVRRPTVPPESPTLGLTHLQFEALLSTARTSPNPHDFALVAMLGLLGLRIFEATSLTLGDLREEHGHRVLHVVGKGTRVVLVPLPPAVGRAVDLAIGDRTSGSILLNTLGRPMNRHAATPPTTPARRNSRRAAAADAPTHAAAHLRHHHAGCRSRPTRRPDRRPPRRPQNHHALRPRPPEPRPPPQLHPRRLHGRRHLTMRSCR